jgi:hypothetical protein
MADDFESGLPPLASSTARTATPHQSAGDRSSRRAATRRFLIPSIILLGWGAAVSLALPFSAQPAVGPSELRHQAEDNSSGLAVNQSTKTLNPEEDNINVPIYIPAGRKFTIAATSPVYEIGQDNCKPDFSHLPPGPASSKVPLKPDWCTEIYDDGDVALDVCKVNQWWRGKDMQVTAKSATAKGSYLSIYKKIKDENSSPQFFVLYEDGNARIKPHPPVGRADVCFGSSVIVGPAKPAARPFVDIEQVVFVTSGTKIHLFLFFSERPSGAHLTLSVDRTAAEATVESIGPVADSQTPLATFRSMWVEDGNADVDRIETPRRDSPILGWDRLAGPSWWFHRKIRSKHNTSSPDIRISVQD